MSNSNDKTGGLLGNPLPIVMLVLLAAGVLVKTVPLQSARPTDPERVTFTAMGQQDVEARLWQDPFAAVEKHEKNSEQAAPVDDGAKTPLVPHRPEALHDRIQALRRPDPHRLTVLAVSVFGGSFDEEAESRRRTRFAVVSALGFHGYSPENSNAIGYFRVALPGPDPVTLTVPYEWFERSGQDSNVLVLWLNEDKLSAAPLKKLHALFAKLTPPRPTGRPAQSSTANDGGFNVKLIGPAGSGMLAELVRDRTTSPTASANGSAQDLAALEGGGRLDVFAPGATVPNCDLAAPAAQPTEPLPWNCFMNKPTRLDELTPLPIVRTIGTDDVLAAALLWELWQRGVNRGPGRVPAEPAQGQAEPPPPCKVGLVLISEWDSAYARALSRHLRGGFSELCGARSGVTTHVRTFTYLRGLDGVLPDVDKSGAAASRKDEGGKAKDLRAQFDDAPPEHAEGRSQYDYLRRLADEIARLDRDAQFAEHGVKAIGIVGSDLYDKLLILQALRSRFKDKIFFTTDLDARYLHADQKDWTRNLVVASNFGLSLRPALQYSTLPFRDSYQTATYLATLMALGAKPIGHWTGKMAVWLRPQIFEIGRTEAVHLASPSRDDLAAWITSRYTDGRAPPAADTTCDGDWTSCGNIEPARPAQGFMQEHPRAMLVLCGLVLLAIGLASRGVQETVRAASKALRSSERAQARAAAWGMIGVVVLAGAALGVIVIVKGAMETSFAQGAGEPFVWLEGISVWPSLVVRFVGLVTMLALVLAFGLWLRWQAQRIATDLDLPLPETWSLARRRWAAVWTGPYLDLASFDREGRADPKLPGATVEIAALWKNYLRATGRREMAGWVLASVLIVGALSWVAFQVFGRPAFPHRGQLVETLHRLLVTGNGLILWLVIFWVGYETRACARFVETLSEVGSLWPARLLDRKEAETGVPRAHLDDYLDFQLIVRVTRRIHRLIYLPFISIFFLVLARSDLFGAMDFPLALVFVTGLALAYALYTAVLLRRSAEAARAKALAHYEARLLRHARPTESPAPIAAEQIRLLIERIRNTREGAFAPFTQQPALQALLLPFGGYGGVQIIEYLINLK